ncbi:hypothetical protein M7I_6595 [Glarea lozoyensis 74030]|uniref:Uncharacterized protein n=1 Tax=Glarea lozoyensis (strain ATCC 74030 / MF5533) TaxID=1104152 RepID=H0EV03_GLAL7|nr:hypothetical protein M7I_6595 [Glarea lozoyensis 74030]
MDVRKGRQAAVTSGNNSLTITGDFVDVNKRRADLFAARMGGQGLFNSPAHAVKITRHDNRYEFEPDTPDILQVEEHSHTSVLTTRRESPVQAVKITRRGNRYEFEPETPEILDVEEWAQMSHIKNARSAGNARDMGWESMDQSPNLPNFVDEYGSRGASARQLRVLKRTVSGT